MIAVRLLPTLALCAAFAAPEVARAQQQAQMPRETKQEAKQETKEAKPDYGTLITPGENTAPSRVEIVSPDVANVQADESALGSLASLTQPVLDDAGRMTTLQGLAGGRPILLQFGYYRCPIVCPLVLGNIARQANEAGRLVPGRDYDVVSFSLDPAETAADAAKARARFMPGVKPELAAAGWHFLTAPAATISALAEACGYRYAHLARSNQFVHPDVVVVLSPKGKVVRFLTGSSFDAAQLAESVKAAREERFVRASEGTFWGKCFDQPTMASAKAKLLMMGGGVLMLCVVACGFFFLRRLELRQRAAQDAVQT